MKCETAVDRGPVGLAGPGVGGGPDGHPAHRLDAGPDDDVHGSGHDGLGREVDGLLGRPALAVDGRPGHGVGEPGGQRRVAADVHGLLAHRHGATHDDVLDQGGVEVVALDQGLERRGGEVDGVPARQLAVAASHRGADCVDDHGIGHRRPPAELSGSCDCCPISGGVSDSRFMDLRFTAEQERFRAEVRALARGQCAIRRRGGRARSRRSTPPRGSRPTGPGNGSCTTPGGRWCRGPRSSGAGEWGWLEWLIFEEEYYRAQAPTRVGQNGIFLLAPTLFEFGTPEQKARYLPAMASGRGDLVPGLVRARRRERPGRHPEPGHPATAGGDWVLNGQKTWCSRGAFADWLFGLFRSDPDGRAAPGPHLLPGARWTAPG